MRWITVPGAQLAAAGIARRMGGHMRVERGIAENHDQQQD